MSGSGPETGLKFPQSSFIWYFLISQSVYILKNEVKWKIWNQRSVGLKLE